MTAFVAWIWQGIALAGVVELLLRAAPRLNAATRHAVWWATLASLVALGAIHAAQALYAAGATAAVGTLAVASASGASALRPPAVELPVPSWLTWCLLAAWLGSAVYGIARAVLGLRRVAALRSAGEPVTESFEQRLPTWSRSRRAGREAGLCTIDRQIGACALGFRRPLILVSRRLADTLPPGLLDQVVMHEQAHLDRFDDWLRLAQAIVTSIAGVHPAVHFVARRIDLEREAACDDRVVAVTGQPAAYASCLADAVSASMHGAPAAVSAAFASSSARALRSRVARLLDPRRDRGRRFAMGASLGAAAWLTGVLAFAPQVPFLLVFVHGTPLQPSAAAEVSRRWPATPVQVVAARSPVSGARADAPVLRAGPRPTSRARRSETAAGEAAASAAAPAETVAQVTEGPLPIEALLVPEQRLLPEALALLGTQVRDVPPVPQAQTPPPAAPGRPDPSFFDDVSSVGRNSAATTWKTGVSLAGTVARAGKGLARRAWDR